MRLMHCYLPPHCEDIHCACWNQSEPTGLPKLLGVYIYITRTGEEIAEAIWQISCPNDIYLQIPK